MFFLNYSQDILYLVLAFCVLWLTVFLVWFVYYLIVTIRQFHTITRDMKKRIDKIDDIIRMTKEKIEHSASYLAIIVEGVKKIADMTKKKKPRKKSK
ncbi:MAG: hypothetical protein ABIG10_01130 [bacterium]